MQKWYKWSWRHFAQHCLCLSERTYMCVCVCVTGDMFLYVHMAFYKANAVHVCYRMCCLSQRRLLPLCQLMAPMSVLHESLDAFIIPQLPVSRWILCCSWTCTHRHIHIIGLYLNNICTVPFMHKQIHGSCRASNNNSFFLLLFFDIITMRVTKTSPTATLIISATLCDKRCVGGVSSALCATAP